MHQDGIYLIAAMASILLVGGGLWYIKENGLHFGRGSENRKLKKIEK